MESKEIHNALCEINDDFLDEFDKNSKKIKLKNKRRKQLISAVACIAVVLIGGIGLAGNIKSDKNIAPVETTLSAKNETTTKNSENNEIKTVKSSENTTVKSAEKETEKTTEKKTTETTLKTKKDNTVTTKKSEQQKGGNTPDSIQDLKIGTDGSYYRVFKPGVDKFEPVDNMTLENRFCSFNYNGKSYYPASDGDITTADYEQKKLASVEADYWVLRSANADDETAGIVYYARIDIYKLKNFDTDEAVACKISFNGETKEYKYIVSDIIYPSWQP